MSAIIQFSPAIAMVPETVLDVISGVEVLRPAIRDTFTSTGGISRPAVAAIVHPVLVGASFLPQSPADFLPEEIHYSATALSTVVSIQTGRASTNNGGLVATLSAASCAGVDWLLLLAPENYKGSTAADRVASHLDELAAAGGIHIDLVGVALVAY